MENIAKYILGIVLCHMYFSYVASLNPYQCVKCMGGHKCQPPDCFCCRDTMPLKVKQVPQMVFFTFDDAITPQVASFYRKLFDSKKKNPNGCPVKMTLFISHANTVYRLVKEFYQKGMEIGSHSVTHKNMNRRTFKKEAKRQKENLARKAGIPSSKIKGWRSPFLKPIGDVQPNTLKELGYDYDATLTIGKSDLRSKPPIPFTLDYGWPYRCKITPCPRTSHKGFWEVPVVTLMDYKQDYECVYVDGCTFPPPDEDSALKFLWKNFESYYNNNRAPFGLNMHASWFYYPDRFSAMIRFIEELGKLDDVYIVSVSQVISWLRHPTPLSQIKSFEPWGCGLTPKKPKQNAVISSSNVNNGHGVISRTNQPNKVSQLQQWRQLVPGMRTNNRPLTKVNSKLNIGANQQNSNQKRIGSQRKTSTNTNVFRSRQQNSNNNTPFVKSRLPKTSTVATTFKPPSKHTQQTKTNLLPQIAQKVTPKNAVRLSLNPATFSHKSVNNRISLNQIFQKNALSWLELLRQQTRRYQIIAQQGMKSKKPSIQKELFGKQTSILTQPKNTQQGKRQKELVEQNRITANNKLSLQNLAEQKRIQNKQFKLEQERLAKQQQIAELNRIQERKRIEEQNRIAELNRIQEQKRLEEEKRLAEQKRIQEEKRLAELKRIEEQKRLEEQRKLEEIKRLEEAKRIAEQKRIEEEKRIAELKRIEELQRIEEQKKIVELKRIEEAKRIAEQKRLEEEKRIAELKAIQEQARKAEERRIAELKRIEKEKKAAEAKRLAEQKRIAEEKRLAELKRAQEQRLLEEQKRLEDLKRILEMERIAEQKRLEELKRLELQKQIAKQKQKEEEKRLAELKRAEEKRRLEEEKRAAELQRIQKEKQLAETKRREEEKRLAKLKRTEEQRRIEEQRRRAEEKRMAQLKAIEEQSRMQQQKRHVQENRAEMKHFQQQKEFLQQDIEEKFVAEKMNQESILAQNEVNEVGKSNPLTSPAYEQADISTAPQIPVSTVLTEINNDHVQTQLPSVILKEPWRSWFFNPQTGKRSKKTSVSDVSFVNENTVTSATEKDSSVTQTTPVMLPPSEDISQLSSSTPQNVRSTINIPHDYSTHGGGIIIDHLVNAGTATTTFPITTTTTTATTSTTKVVPSSTRTSTDAMLNTAGNSKCQQEVNCFSPKCICKSETVPGGLDPAKIPQIVYITIDGDMNFLTYSRLRTMFSPYRVNPNGCPLRGTFFTSDNGVSFGLSHLANGGNIEIALNGLKGTGYNYARNMKNDIEEQTDKLEKRLHIHTSNIKGWRSPGLRNLGDKQFEILKNFSLYDSSLISERSEKGAKKLWPFTLDFGWNEPCKTSKCPEKEHPGVWEVPIIPLAEQGNTRSCIYADSCYNQPTNLLNTYRYLWKNFESFYTTNKAPFGIHITQKWFQWYYSHNMSGLLKFLDTISKMQDVYVVSVSDVIEWIKKPTPLSDIKNFVPWKC